ncbi:hypothetical protein J5N97_021382 [Dioscorea zingiberensis]|uniref:Sialyltransferase-like protein 1 n=1 Tax=Dioscorea zingiberensis TaxID=325984 RepID=A0A9D5CHJ0_9LILI|nr:hypothetical protein J5N97_021382 [Dioscorea zingiberensis]
MAVKIISVDPTARMKRSLRVRITLFLLIAITTILLRCFISESPPPFIPLNSNLLQLAAIDTGDAELRKETQALLDSSFRSVLAARYRSISHSQPHSIGSPIESRAQPAFRRYLRQWYLNKRYQPGVMSDLLRLVKPHIDHAFGYPNNTTPYASCAVVGNSGILLNSNHGDLIDSHDLVIRLNFASIAGYRTYVGGKTSLAFINSNVLHLCARRRGCFCHPYGEFVPTIMYICQAAHFVDYVACNASHKAGLLVTDARFDVLCARIAKYYSLKRFVEETRRSPEEWGKMRDERMFHYSSGMQAVMLAVGLCDRVSVFGYGKAADAKHHYYTSQKAELDLHDYEAEYEFYGDLGARPEVIPFLKDSGFKVPPVLFYG